MNFLENGFKLLFYLLVQFLLEFLNILNVLIFAFEYSAVANLMV